MQCKDCSKFKPLDRMEAGSEISPDLKAVKGKCTVSNKNCSSNDNCGCGSFSKK
ncbi:hypothetical protein V6C42_01785 [Pseudoclostridium thermosuccinogenes]|jgi:hypothetical protein|uniref:hypothetical protein n=1 Tax=Clostridium thermosuccinogenes TaxID=84032 RepID=UPI001374766B|nr:hypothetical protein [Pseudoclostridium thermosuccinogenes]